MADWINFYDLRHSLIYVNAHHRDVHYRKIAEELRGYIPSLSTRVMDYGCGEATSAALVASACAALTLVEAAPNLYAALSAHYAGNSKITVLTPEQASALPDHSFDLIVLHSVAQYLTGEQLNGLLETFRRLLIPDGLLLVGDVVRPRFAVPAAALSLLRFSAANGFFWSAVGGLIRIFVSDYLRLKKTVGLSHYEPGAMLEKLRCAGYAAERAPRNVGHNPWRVTFLARPLKSPADNEALREVTRR